MAILRHPCDQSVGGHTAMGHLRIRADELVQVVPPPDEACRLLVGHHLCHACRRQHAREPTPVGRIEHGGLLSLRRTGRRILGDDASGEANVANGWSRFGAPVTGFWVMMPAARPMSPMN